jgi:hypothetical protein
MEQAGLGGQIHLVEVLSQQEALAVEMVAQHTTLPTMADFMEAAVVVPRLVLEVQ